ncbi:MAG: hypothetical protein LBQ80_01805, partial [Clostridium sp.]|nr:hypothetical protein [Clostridium sp.]
MISPVFCVTSSSQLREAGWFLSASLSFSKEREEGKQTAVGLQLFARTMFGYRAGKFRLKQSIERLPAGVARSTRTFTSNGHSYVRPHIRRVYHYPQNAVTKLSRQFLQKRVYRSAESTIFGSW